LSQACDNRGKITDRFDLQIVSKISTAHTTAPHSTTHGDACFAYFNKIWGIPLFRFLAGAYGCAIMGP
jgi:hypothetical protein